MEETLAYHAIVLYKSFFAYTASQLQSLGLTNGMLPFVLYVGKHPGCTPTALKERLRLDWGHTQRCISRLEGDGFLVKRHSQQDKRTYHLTLTEKGSRAFAVSHQVFRDWDGRKLDKLTEEERATLFNLLHKLLPERETEIK